MAKSTKEYISMYRDILKKLDSEKDEAIQKYFDQRFIWLNNIERNLRTAVQPDVPNLSSFDKIPNIEFSDLHQRYAVKYSSIVGPVAEVSVNDEGYGNSRVIKRGCVDSIFLDSEHVLGDLASLWTVLEYVGHGVYKDLITGRCFSTPVKSSLILDAMAKGNEGRVHGIKLGLVAEPLRIKGIEVTKTINEEVDGVLVRSEEPIIDDLIPDVNELTYELQSIVLRDTLPKSKEIISALNVLEREASRKVLDYYGKLSSKQEESEFTDFMTLNEDTNREAEVEKQLELESALISEDVLEEQLKRETERMQKYLDEIGMFESEYPMMGEELSEKRR